MPAPIALPTFLTVVIFMIFLTFHLTNDLRLLPHITTERNDRAAM
jgi:hypothetical protein